MFIFVQGCSLLFKVFGTLAGCSVYAKICTTDVTNAVQIMANKCRNALKYHKWLNFVPKPKALVVMIF